MITRSDEGWKNQSIWHRSENISMDLFPSIFISQITLLIEGKTRQISMRKKRWGKTQIKGKLRSGYYSWHCWGHMYKNFLLTSENKDEKQSEIRLKYKNSKKAACCEPSQAHFQLQTLTITEYKNEWLLDCNCYSVVNDVRSSLSFLLIFVLLFLQLIMNLWRLAMPCLFSTLILRPCFTHFFIFILWYSYF